MGPVVAVRMALKKGKKAQRKYQDHKWISVHAGALEMSLSKARGYGLSERNWIARCHARMAKIRY